MASKELVDEVDAELFVVGGAGDEAVEDEGPDELGEGAGGVDASVECVLGGVAGEDGVEGLAVLLDDAAAQGV